MLKNLSDKDMPIGIDINLYVGGNKMESYANEHTMGSITPGRSMEGSPVEHFGLKVKEFRIRNKTFLCFFGEKPAIVSIDVK